MTRAAPALAAALLATACATAKVTLLDNEPGSGTGALAVLGAGGGETVIDRPLTEAALRNGPTRPKAVKAIKPAYAALISSLPPAAKPFEFTFDTGKSEIRDDQRPILEQLRTELSIRPGAQIEVAGFTDSEGSNARNDEISLERAESVARQLRNFGFDVKADDAIGRGEDDAKRLVGDGVRDERFRKVVVIVR